MHFPLRQMCTGLIPCTPRPTCEASYPLLKTAEASCAHGVIPATTVCPVTDWNPAEMEYAMKPCKDVNAILATDRRFSLR